MPRQRKHSNASSASSLPDRQQVSLHVSAHQLSVLTEQELESMYDYLAKVILIGPSGTGKCVYLPVSVWTQLTV
jgi:hypothetical protein